MQDYQSSLGSYRKEVSIDLDTSLDGRNFDSKSLGQFFTPRLVSDFMVSLISHKKDSKILEPSAGKGVFQN